MSFSTNVRIVSNYGAENDTLEQLIRDLGYLAKAGLDAEFVKVNGPIKNLEALVNGEADLCVLSGLNPLADIEKGAQIKLIGSAMKMPALAMFSKSPKIHTVRDLAGRTIGVGPKGYLLHATTIALLRKHDLSEKDVTLVEIGSNAQVFQAVAKGEVDAGPSSVASFYHQNKLGVHSLTDGTMWSELPSYTNQIMYAPEHAITDKRETIVRTLAAFARLFNYLQTPGSQDSYASARALAAPGNGTSESEAVYRFMQEQKPYGSDILITDERLNYMQDLLASLCAIASPMSLERIADMSMARDAMKMTGLLAQGEE